MYFFSGTFESNESELQQIVPHHIRSCAVTHRSIKSHRREANIKVLQGGVLPTIIYHVNARGARDNTKLDIILLVEVSDFGGFGVV